jgi:hypothetical protein
MLANRDGYEMKVARLHIQSFRGIKEATLNFPDHVVLVGDNNVGKSSVFEALDLALGPDRLARRPKIDEHDFFRGDYISAEGEPRKEVKIEVTVTGLTEEQKNRFVDCVEWWDTATKSLLVAPPAEGTENPTVHAALRVSFVGFYDPEEDDFDGETDSPFAVMCRDAGKATRDNLKELIAHYEESISLLGVGTAQRRNVNAQVKSQTTGICCGKEHALLFRVAPSFFAAPHTPNNEMLSAMCAS